MLQSTSRNSQMRILVDNGAYDCANFGDVAMMQVTVSRLHSAWPNASIEVITDNHEALAKYCADAKPVPAKGRNAWFLDRNLLGRFHGYLPNSISRSFDDLKRMMRRSLPSILTPAIMLKLKLGGSDVSKFKAFREAYESADIVVACGMGGLTDHCPEASLALLEFLQAASQRQIPTAMFSQGIGPMTNPQLRSMASKVLPRVDVLAIRETRAAIPLLKSLGVSHHKLLATGDDAIELAYSAPSSSIGECLGVNLRVARSAGVDSGFIDRLRPIVRTISESHNARLIPLPIGTGNASHDQETLTRLLYSDDRVQLKQMPDTPIRVIEQIASCRVVLTGAYHAAVFALAQGVPVVCLARSPYFIDKFLGLAQQFGTGCEVVLLDSSNLDVQIISAVDKLWASADELRPQLRHSALRQIEASRNAYARFAEIVTERCQLQTSPVIKPQTSGAFRAAV